MILQFDIWLQDSGRCQVTRSKW